MGFSLSFSLFFVVSVFYVVVVDVLTLLFRITGLTAEQAKFQVISMLTNSGYTTQESELVVDQPVRRRMARFIMLFGYIFSITIVSVFVNLMLALPSSEKEEVWPALIVISSLFVVFIIVRRIPVVRTAFNSVAEQWGRRWMYGRSGSNMVLVQDEYADGVIAVVTLNNVPSLLDGKSVQEWNDENDHGVYVLYISRGAQLLHRATRETFFEQGDAVTVFGRDLETIREVFGGGGQTQKTAPLSKTPRPVSEREFIHEQDEQAAREAAMQARKQQETAVPKASELKGAGPVVQEIAAELVKSTEQMQPRAEMPASGVPEDGQDSAKPDRILRQTGGGALEEAGVSEQSSAAGAQARSVAKSDTGKKVAANLDAGTDGAKSADSPDRSQGR